MLTWQTESKVFTGNYFICTSGGYNSKATCGEWRLPPVFYVLIIKWKHLFNPAMWWFQRRNTCIYSKSSTSTARSTLFPILQVPPVFIATMPDHDLPGFRCEVPVIKLQRVLTLLSYAGKFRRLRYEQVLKARTEMTKQKWIVRDKWKCWQQWE